MRSLSSVLGMVTAVVLASGSVPSVANAAPPAAVPPYTLEERAEAIARPALIFIEVRAQGFVRNKATGELVAPDPIAVYSRCSGFVVSTTGHVVTAAHCAQPTASWWRDGSFTALADRLIGQKTLLEDQKAAYVADLTANADYTGPTPESQPEIKLLAQQNALRNRDAALPGQVVVARSLTDENVALVKLAIGGLPVVELGTVAGIDEQLTLLAYGAISAGGERTFVPRSRTARISGLPAKPTGPSKLDSDLGTYSHGGMAVDRTGKAVGLINIDRDTKGQPRRAMVSAAALKVLLEGAGVANGLGSADLTYRAGLDAYFGGRYSEAIERFDEVLGVVPDHQQATSYRQQAADRRAIEGDPESGLSLGPLLIAGGTGAVVVAGLIVLIMIVSRQLRRRRRGVYRELAASPLAPPVSAVPVSAYPVSGDGAYSITGYEPIGSSLSLAAEPAWPDSVSAPESSSGPVVESASDGVPDSERDPKADPAPREPDGNPWAPPTSP